VSRPTKRVGRINFILRTLVVTGMAFALEFLGDELLHLLLSRSAYALQRVAVFGLIGLFLMAVIDGRLLDAGLPGWCRYPAYFVWLVATSLPAIWSPAWPIGLVLFVLLLIAGAAFPGKQAQFNPAMVSPVAEIRDEMSEPVKRRHSRWFADPVGFLRSLLTLACLWLPLIWLEDISSGDPRVWIARFGYLILSFVWFYKVVGRLYDAGRSPRKIFGYLFIGLLLLIKMLLRLRRRGSSTGRYALLISAVASISSTLHAWLRLINGYELLAVFMLAQIPLAFMPSKPRQPEPVSENDDAEEGSHKPAPTNVLALSGPFEYLRIISVIACLFVPLIYMDHAFAGTAGSWIARLGYLVLGFFWLAFANGRLEDAGWAQSDYPAQFGLIVSVASLMPIAVHWVNAYGALVIFVLIQAPTAFLRSKPIPYDPLPEGS
jgi:hypothetical protein